MFFLRDSRSCKYLSPVKLMSKPDPTISKSRISSHDRDVRSRLSQLVTGKAILHGALNPCARTCGKSNCKCARGDKHTFLYVVVTGGGKTRHLHVPESHEDKVRQWVEHYQQARQLHRSFNRFGSAITKECLA